MVVSCSSSGNEEGSDGSAPDTCRCVLPVCEAGAGDGVGSGGRALADEDAAVGLGA